MLALSRYLVDVVEGVRSRLRWMIIFRLFWFRFTIHGIRYPVQIWTRLTECCSAWRPPLPGTGMGKVMLFRDFVWLTVFESALFGVEL